MLAENDASRASRLFCEAFCDRDWERFEALLAEEFVVDDRRKLIGGLSTDRRGYIQTWKVIADQGYDKIDVTDLATRRDALVLQHFLAHGAHDFTAEALGVVETARGQMTFMGVFDPGDLDAAYEELDAHYLAGEGAPYADFVNLVKRNMRAHDAADWETVRATLADDLVVIDHRLASFGERVAAADVWVESQKILLEFLSSFRTRITAIHEQTPTSGVAELVGAGVTKEDTDVELAMYVLATAEGGCLNRIEYFAPEDRAAALERFEELTAKGGGSRPSVP